MTIRVVIAEDEDLIRSGLTMILQAQPDIEVVADVHDGDAAVRAVLDLSPDVAVLDVRMPSGREGVEAARRIAGDETIARLGRTVGVLMLTTFSASDAVYEAIRVGATGFVLKDATPSDLAAAVRAVAAGDAWLAPAVTRAIVRDLAGATRALPAQTSASRDLPPGMTPRERQVLELMAYGLTNEEIARHHGVVVGTVKTHVNRIFNKLQVRDRAQAVAWAYRHRLVGPDDPLPPASTLG
ncbi:response regulator [Pseudonocardia sp.]|uniref:response regulator transcription factor n=1 Tax=Pseudonocardia sp. TaxID=60912 RepID=UPI003D13FE29